MNKNTPERLLRWMLLCEQPERLPLEHGAQIDLAWAADEIARLTTEVEAARSLKMLADSTADDCHQLIVEARSALQTIYATNGEDIAIEKICNPLISKLGWNNDDDYLRCWELPELFFNLFPQHRQRECCVLFDV